MKKKLKKIPKFKTEDEEREFWDTHSSMDYIDWSKAKQGIFPNLKLTTQPISIRLTTSMIGQLKQRAHSINVPYQSLIKQYIANALEK